MAATKTSSGEFRVALNPRNPEANSWYDPSTGINLFLNTPESKNLSAFANDQLKAVATGIRAGLLIVSRGTLPENLLDVSEINAFAAPRSRWGEGFIKDNPDLMGEAIKNHEAALTAK